MKRKDLSKANLDALDDYFNKIFPLKYTYFYHLDHNDLDFVESEKDLGVMVGYLALKNAIEKLSCPERCIYISKI